MGFPQFDLTGITAGISRTLSALLSIRFNMPGLPGSTIPGWLIALVIVLVALGFQFRKTR